MCWPVNVRRKEPELAFDDMFGSRRRAFEENGETAPKQQESYVTPTANAEDDMQRNPGGGIVEPLVFEGYASPKPLLLERPSRYVRRMLGAEKTLIRTKDGKSRAMLSPAVSLPFLLLDGTETFSKDTVGYPLLYAPQNHPLEQGADLERYVLTLIVLYTSVGFIHEPGDGSLLAYPIDGNFEVADETWDAAEEWAEYNLPALKALNIGRLVGFTLRRPEEERALNALMTAWGVDSSVDKIIGDARKAADTLALEYDVITDLEYQPFYE